MKRKLYAVFGLRFWKNKRSAGGADFFRGDSAKMICHDDILSKILFNNIIIGYCMKNKGIFHCFSCN